MDTNKPENMEQSENEKPQGVEVENFEVEEVEQVVATLPTGGDNGFDDGVY
jgi:hypothetical protein